MKFVSWGSRSRAVGTRRVPEEAGSTGGLDPDHLLAGWT